MHSSSSAAADSRGSSRSPIAARRVVDAPTRMFHALLALSFVGAYLTADSEPWRRVHVTLGYAFAGLLVFRLLYGIVGPRQARLGLLRRRLTGVAAWLRALRSAPSLAAVQWRQGQSLGTAVAIVAMLALGVPLTISGYGAYNDWGEWLEELHELAGTALLGLVLLHLTLIAVASLLRRQNLARPMLTGRAPGIGPDLVRHDRAWLAGLLLMAVLALGAWQWRAAPRESTSIGGGASSLDARLHGSGRAARSRADED